MKKVGFIFVFALALLSRALGGTFTVHSTRISVPASADGLADGETSDSSTNLISLDANVYIPDGVTALVRFDDASLIGGELGPGRHRISR